MFYSYRNGIVLAFFLDKLNLISGCVALPPAFFLIDSLHLFYYVAIFFSFLGKQECSVCINLINACVFWPYLVVEWSIAVYNQSTFACSFCVAIKKHHSLNVGPRRVNRHGQLLAL